MVRVVAMCVCVFVCVCGCALVCSGDAGSCTCLSLAAFMPASEELAVHKHQWQPGFQDPQYQGTF